MLCSERMIKMLTFLFIWFMAGMVFTVGMVFMLYVMKGLGYVVWEEIIEPLTTVHYLPDREKVQRRR